MGSYAQLRSGSASSASEELQNFLSERGQGVSGSSSAEAMISSSKVAASNANEESNVSKKVFGETASAQGSDRSDAEVPRGASDAIPQAAKDHRLLFYPEEKHDGGVSSCASSCASLPSSTELPMPVLPPAVQKKAIARRPQDMLAEPVLGPPSDGGVGGLLSAGVGGAGALRSGGGVVFGAGAGPFGTADYNSLSPKTRNGGPFVDGASGGALSGRDGPFA